MNTGDLFDELTHAAMAGDPTGQPRDGIPVHESDARAALDLIGQRQRAGEQIRAQAMRDLAVWAPVAIRAGVPVGDVADLAGVSRQTIHAITRNQTT